MNRITNHIKYPVIEKKTEPVVKLKIEDQIELPASRSRYWTMQENEYLKKVYASSPVFLIAQHLKRSIGSITHQARVLKITAQERGTKSHRVGTDNWGWRKGF